MKTIFLDGETLSIEDVVAVARENAKVEIPDYIKKRVIKSCRVLKEILDSGIAVYGVNTGFGALSKVKIPKEEQERLQLNMVRSHSAGVGEPLPTDVIRATMLLRANMLARGYSGIRLEVLETLIKMLNEGVHPIVPEKGSVGASGDLAPLAHIALVLIGEGKAEYKGEILSGKEALEKAGIDPLKLKAKEAMALINGTQLMTAMAALAVHDAENLVRTAEIAAALSLEVLNGVFDAFEEKVNRLRPHTGQVLTARNVRQLIKGSKLILSGREAYEKLGYPHDPYTLRCIPQVIGAARDAIAYARKIVETEINSVTDNPLIFPDDKACISAGNFHGQPIAVAMDTLGIAITIIGGFSERRIARLIDEKLNRGLPPFLVSKEAKEGINSGFMLAQYTAAALASENKVLAHPASIDSIPTSANFEDYVSMGTTAAKKATEIIENTWHILAIELLCACQAADLRGADKLGKGTKIAYSTIRSSVPMLKEDRVLSDDIKKICEIIKMGRLVREVEKAVRLV